MIKIKVVSKNYILSSLLLACISSPLWALNCDGKITGVLSGNPYCSAGERVGFTWTGGTPW